MGEYIEIEITINTMLISDVHKTIKSILEQVNINYFNIYIRFINPNNLNIQQEIKNISSPNIKVVNDPTDSNFLLYLEAGETLSRLFLYKGVHFLLRNQAAFVCPEYTFRRIDNSLTITATHNNQALFGQPSCYLLHRNKSLQNTSPLSPRASVIENTCSAKTIATNFNSYLDNITKEVPYFKSNIFLPCNLPLLDMATPQKNSKLRKIKQKSISIIKNVAKRSRILRKIFKRHATNPTPTICLDNKMIYELEQLSDIEFGLKGFQSMNVIDITNKAFQKAEVLFSIYRTVAEQLDHSDYSYMMVLPWIISGGIDLFAINYLRTISNLHPTENILVLLTNDEHRSYTKEELDLPSNITLIEFSQILKTPGYKDFLPELIYSLINTLKPNRVHIMASKAGYDCLSRYGDDIRSNNAKIIFSSYNYLVGSHGEYMGYTVQELPEAYRPGDIITTDNSASKKLWVNHFGFIANDILIHHQLFDYEHTLPSSPTSKDGFRILWAAHIRPEKNPVILPEIAKSLQNDKIDIDCYGLFMPIHWNNGKNPLETNQPNLHYMGPYTDFFKDIDLTKYDIFLYTSHADGTPNVVIEAALANLPIIASRIGGIPEALENDAILIDDTYSAEQFSNAVKTVLSNLNSYRKKANLLRKKLLSKHSDKNFVAQVKEMLERSR